MLQERNENRKQALHLPTKNPISNQKQVKNPKENVNKAAPKEYQKVQKLATLESSSSKSKDTFQVVETNKIKNHYLNSIMSYELLKIQDNFRSDFLKRHKLTAEIRARMVL